MSSFYLMRAYGMVRERLAAIENEQIRSSPLSRWAESRDAVLPKKLLDLTVQQVVKMKFDDITSSHEFKRGDMQKLLDLLGRAASSSGSRPKRSVAKVIDRAAAAARSPKGKRIAKVERAAREQPAAAVVPKKRGRKPKAKPIVVVAPRKRGRPGVKKMIELQETEKLGAQYEEIRRRIVATAPRDLTGRSFDTLLVPMDRYIPRVFMSATVGDFLAIPFDELGKRKGIGVNKLNSLMKILTRLDAKLKSSPREFTTSVAGEANRARGSASRRDESALDSVVSLPADPADLTAEQWERCGRIVTDHELDEEPIGRYAPRLLDLTKSLWRRPFSFFTSKTIEQIHEHKSFGPMKFGQSMRIVLSVCRYLINTPRSKEYVVRVYPREIGAAVGWIDRVLETRSDPDLGEITTRLIEPLLKRIELDAGEYTATIIRRRLGVGGERETLGKIGDELGVSRERVRQIEAEAAAVFSLRLPRGLQLINDLYDHIEEQPDPFDRLELIGGLRRLLYRM